MNQQIPIDFSKGYHDTGEPINAPNGSLISPSTNILYTKQGKPISAKNNLLVGEEAGEGGTRAFTLDNNLVAFLGNNDTTEKANGVALLSSNKDLWFVGNNLSNSVRVSDSFSSFLPIGGTSQLENISVSLSAVSISIAGDVDLIFTGANIANSPVTVTVNANLADTATDIATALVEEANQESDITDNYFVYRDGFTIYLLDKQIRANDATLNMEIASGTATEVNDVATSTTSTSGSLDYSANLSTVPQVAKWNGTGWNNPVQVGLAPEDTAPSMSLTSPTTKGAEFTGLLTGSFSAKVARKREGVISIASPKSEVLTADANTMYLTIPLYPEDGSVLTDRSWALYFTPSGRGSQDSHLLFPIYIRESVLSGYEGTDYFESFGQCKVKLISSSTTLQADRILEIEFNDNELLLIQTFDDYFSLDSCKFLQPLGNVMCGIGTGTNQTGFDVSYPNNRQAYPTQYRDWFKEVPISIATSAELGMFWIMGTNTIYQAVWTGASTESAPVIIREISSKYGVIGEGASTSINGFLYFVSKGRIPVRVSPNGEIDDSFGNSVLNYFNTYSSSLTQVGYDEELNTVFFINGTQALGFQIDTQLWTSPVDLLTSAYGLDVTAAFSLNGKMHYCAMKDSLTALSTLKFDSDTLVDDTIDWRMVSNFYTGNNGVNLKDLIEMRAIVESKNYTDTLDFKAYKNFEQSMGLITLFSKDVTENTFITIRELLESLDYESIAIVIDGNKFRQTVQSVLITMQNHNIERYS